MIRKYSPSAIFYIGIRFLPPGRNIEPAFYLGLAWRRRNLSYAELERILGIFEAKVDAGIPARPVQ